MTGLDFVTVNRMTYTYKLYSKIYVVVAFHSYGACFSMTFMGVLVHIHVEG